MRVSKLLNHINATGNSYVMLTYALASNILHIFEEECPEDFYPRRALELVKLYLDGEDVSKEEFRLSAAAAYSAAYSAAAAYAAYAAANAAAATYAGYAAANAAAAAYDGYTGYAAAANAAYWADKVTSEEHAVKLIYSMMPQIIDYAIKNQERLFTGPGDFTEVFDKLDDAIREKVIWNMELFR